MSVIPFERSEPQFFVRVENNRQEARVLVASEQGGGDPLPEGVSRLLSFEYVDDERRADTLKLTINNEDLSNFDDPVWKKGNRIAVRWGYPGRMAPERSLIITKVMGFRQLTVEARAESVVMNRVVRNRLFENRKASDIVREIAAENGWGDDSVDIEDTEVVLPCMQQARQTDAQFIRRLANREGFEFYVDFDGFHFHRRRVEARPIRRFRYYTDPQLGEILDIQIENDVTARPGRVRSRSRDPINGEDLEGSSGTSPDGEGGSSPALVRDALTGVLSIIEPGSARDENEENVAQEAIEPNSATNGNALQREADARQRRHQQTAVKMRMDVIGDPQLYAKTVIQLEGVGRRLSIRYWVKAVSHKLGPGYTCSLTCISDGHGGHETSSTRAQGIDLIDVGPANRGRRNQGEGPERESETSAEDGPPELTQVLARDEDTGRLRIQFRDGQGRLFGDRATAAEQAARDEAES